MSLFFAKNKNKVKKKKKIANIDDERFFRQRYKIEIVKQKILYAEVLREQQATSASFCLNYELHISISQINRIRQEWHLARKQGRPRNAKETKQSNQIKTLLPQAGVSLFARWIEETGRPAAVYSCTRNAASFGLLDYAQFSAKTECQNAGHALSPTGRHPGKHFQAYDCPLCAGHQFRNQSNLGYRSYSAARPDGAANQTG